MLADAADVADHTGSSDEDVTTETQASSRVVLGRLLMQYARRSDGDHWLLCFSRSAAAALHQLVSQQKTDFALQTNQGH